MDIQICLTRKAAFDIGFTLEYDDKYDHLKNTYFEKALAPFYKTQRLYLKKWSRHTNKGSVRNWIEEMNETIQLSISRSIINIIHEIATANDLDIKWTD